MTPDDDTIPERDGDSVLAAEYVLGVLPAQERQAVAQRIETDRDFARLVDAWEGHLAPLASAYPSAEAPAGVKAALDRRLFGTAEAATGTSLWTSLPFWRGLTAAALAALLLVLAIPFLQPPVAEPDTRYIASLAADASDVRYLALYDQEAGKVSLAHVSGQKEVGRDFELWMIEGDNVPVSMGVLPGGEAIQITITPEIRAKLAAGAVLAISLEPAGGSPTGQPTGPVVAAGDLKSI